MESILELTFSFLNNLMTLNNLSSTQILFVIIKLPRKYKYRDLITRVIEPISSVGKRARF